MGSRVGRALARLEAIHPAWIGLAIGLVAVAFRIAVGVGHAGDTFGHVIKGVPVSDARRWAVMAEDFARGQRWDPTWGMWWDGVRPLYWMFLGSLFALTGPSVVAAWAANVAFGAIAAVLMFEIVRRLANAWLGAIAGLALALDFENARYALSVTTEPLGNVLALVALYFIVLGTSARRSAASFAGGIALGLCNLARPLSLAAAATVPFAMALVLRRKPDATAWRRVIGVTAWFIAGVTAAIAPWMLRQRVVHEVWTISVNSAEMAYAAATRRYGRWTPEGGALGGRFPTIRERVEFYDPEARRSLARGPGCAVARTARDLLRVADRTKPPRWPLVAACAVWLALALARDRRRAVVPCLAAAAAAVLVGLGPTAPVASLWVAATLAACLTRDLVAVPGTILATTVLTMAALSVPNDPRIFLQGQPFALLLSLWVVWRALDLADRLGGRERTASVAETTGWGRAGKVVAAVAIAACGVLGVGTLKALVARAGAVPPPAVRLAPDAAQPWIRAVGERAPEYAPLVPRLEVRLARIRPDYRIALAPGERVAHWNPVF